jgi:hypothetical protein
MAALTVVHERARLRREIRFADACVALPAAIRLYYIETEARSSGRYRAEYRFARAMPSVAAAMAV